jgi:hypothetical protein
MKIVLPDLPSELPVHESEAGTFAIYNYLNTQLIYVKTNTGADHSGRAV